MLKSLLTAVITAGKVSADDIRAAEWPRGEDTGDQGSPWVVQERS